MNAQKRLLSLLLALCLVLALVPAAFAEDGEIIGNTDNTTGYWTAPTKYYFVPVGATATVTFNNYSAGINNYQNYYIHLLNGDNVLLGEDNYTYNSYLNEFALCRADNFGWYYGNNTANIDFNDDNAGREIITEGFEAERSNIEGAENASFWEEFRELMKNSEVTLTIENTGDAVEITSVATNSSKTYTQNYSLSAVPNGKFAEGNILFGLTVERAHLQITQPVQVEIDGYTTISPAVFSSSTAEYNWGAEHIVPANSTATIEVKNFTPKGVFWRNLCINMWSEDRGLTARADNWGWWFKNAEQNYDGITPRNANDYNFHDKYKEHTTDLTNAATFNAQMDNSDVLITIVNEETVSIDMQITTANGVVVHQKYKDLPLGNKQISFTIGAPQAMVFEKVNSFSVSSNTPTPTTYTVTFTTNTAATVKVYRDEGKTTKVGEDVVISSTTGSIDLSNGIYYYTATPTDSTNYQEASDSFEVESSARQVEITMESVSTPEPSKGGYLKTTYAEINTDLRWRLFFFIYESVIAEPVTNAKISVASESDPTIDGVYDLTYDTARTAYYITVPIRPRLIDQAVTFSLVSADGNTTYPISIGESGVASESIDYTFDTYLDKVVEIAPSYSDIVTTLRAFKAALQVKWGTKPVGQ